MLQGRGIDRSLFSAQSAGVPVIEAFVWEALEGELKEGDALVTEVKKSKSGSGGGKPLGSRF